jgi:hypothetical protein
MPASASIGTCPINDVDLIIVSGVSLGGMDGEGCGIAELWWDATCMCHAGTATGTPLPASERRTEEKLLREKYIYKPCQNLPQPASTGTHRPYLSS